MERLCEIIQYKGFAMGLCIGNLYPNLLFENFIHDESNGGAFATAKLIAMGHVIRVPVVFYSGPGIGKTHLLHSIGNEALCRAPKLKVTILSSEWFTTQFLTSKRNDALKTFKDKYQERQNIFMVDDLSFIDNKPMIQKELYRIFKLQSKNGCRIVLASSITLDAMTDWHKEFREWLESGEFYIITNPSAEARKLFLKRLLAKNKIALNDDLIECFHQEAGASFRELEAAVLRVRAAANLYNAELRVEFARKIMRELALR